MSSSSDREATKAAAAATVLVSTLRYAARRRAGSRRRALMANDPPDDRQRGDVADCHAEEGAARPMTEVAQGPRNAEQDARDRDPQHHEAEGGVALEALQDPEGDGGEEGEHEHRCQCDSGARDCKSITLLISGIAAR